MEKMLMTAAMAVVLILSVGYLVRAEKEITAPMEETISPAENTHSSVETDETEPAEKEIALKLPAKKVSAIPSAAIREEQTTDAPRAECDYLLLVNAETPIPDDYQAEIVDIPTRNTKGEKTAAEALCEMLAAGEREGMRFVVCSGYRTQDDQRKLYLNQIQKKLAEGLSETQAVTEAEKFSARPGYSEHQTGLAFDIVALAYQNLDAGYAETPEAKWLLAHAENYGFILRYPASKESVTGIGYEPWHYRYVGRVAARAITRSAITLEEYKALGVDG